MSLIAILTSVISAVYYLAIIKQIFFDTNAKDNEKLEEEIQKIDPKETKILFDALRTKTLYNFIDSTFSFVPVSNLIVTF